MILELFAQFAVIINALAELSHTVAIFCFKTPNVEEHKGT